MHLDPLHYLGSIGEAVQAASLSRDAAIVAAGSVLVAVAPGNPHVTGGYLIGIIGMSMYYLSRTLIVWLEGRNRIVELERRLNDRDVELAKSSAEAQELRADLRKWIEHAIGTRPIGDTGPSHPAARDSAKILPDPPH
jgi:hypothetical protein